MSLGSNSLSGPSKSHYSADVNVYRPLQPGRPVIVCVWSPEDVTDWMSLSQMCVNEHVESVLQSNSLSPYPAFSPQRVANGSGGPGGNLCLWSCKCFLYLMHTHTHINTHMERERHLIWLSKRGGIDMASHRKKQSEIQDVALFPSVCDLLLLVTRD